MAVGDFLPTGMNTLMRDKEFLKAEVASGDATLWSLRLQLVIMSSDTRIRTGIFLFGKVLVLPQVFILEAS